MCIYIWICIYALINPVGHPQFICIWSSPSAMLCQLKISTSGQDHQPSNQSVPTALSDQLLAPSQDDILENLEKIWRRKIGGS